MTTTSAPALLPQPGPALTLHMAAARLRAAAEAAIARQTEDGHSASQWAYDLDGYLGGPIGEFCGLMSPQLALEIADDLDRTAAGAVRHANAGGTQEEITNGYPIRLARHILGETS